MIALAAERGQVLEAMVGRGNVEMLNGSTRAAVDMLTAAGERMREESPAAGAALLVQAVLPCLLRRDLERGPATSPRARAALVPEPDPALAAQIAAALADHRDLLGQPAGARRAASPPSCDGRRPRASPSGSSGRSGT